jgi:hypothetical protein
MAPDDRLTAAEINKLGLILNLLASDRPERSKRLPPRRHGSSGSAICNGVNYSSRHYRSPTLHRACRQDGGLLSISVRAHPRPSLSPWERQFIATVARYRHAPSSVRLDILASVAARALAGEGGA